MKRIFKILIFIFIALNIYSMIPVVSLYLTKTPVNIKTNKGAIEKLAGNKKPYFAFMVTSDTGTGFFMNESATLKIVSSMNYEDRFQKIPIDFVANVGDVTFRGRESHYRNYVKIKNMVKFPVIDVMGNHDDDWLKDDILFKKFCGDKEFAFADRNSYFIVLDNKDGSLTDRQFGWLENELNKAKNYAHTFIFMHKPPFNPYQQAWYRAETNPWSYRFLKLCDKYKVAMVFSGHENVSRVVKFGSVTYLVCGGGGTLLIQPSWEGGILNYIFVKVNGDYLDYEIRKVNPPAWEFFTYYIWKDLVFWVKSWLD